MKIINSPDYNPDEILNIAGLNAVSKAGKYMQDNKESRSKTTGEVKIKVKMLSGLNTGKDLILTITLMLLMEKNLRTRVQLI